MKLIKLWPIFLIFAVANVFADTKIGFVDTQRILREASPAVRAAKKLEKEFEPRRAEMQRVSAQGKLLQQVLDKNNISESDRRIKERELIKLNQDFQRMQREINEDLNARRNEELAGLQERVNLAIRTVAEGEKLDLVVQDAVYRNPKIDVTDKVLKLLVDK
ncbi:OmpH family outer membrane protein [Deefgea piscis]|uniref:OmpH family outer membrane protein n=1 Tax=Deefgea piscis TaxID=2739061 RepID=A0A6M8SW81_9NEIS|nr:OmpH family outer membrane protein [Deefgea piscis]QKJ67846.1 OmpH family outer membrane protein [Deefgea piscis]QZA79983.1 OmpH family outer membrane protein [Deefgea piscis]